MACLHLSTLNKYTESLSETDKKAAGKMTLGALSQGLNWKPDATFGTVSPLENLTVVQALMKANRECSDVFVTLDGSARTAAKRWITSDDILRAANA